MRITTCRASERKNEKEREGDCEREGHKHKMERGGEKGRRGYVLAISHSVTAPWLFMESFLSWCCFLIDIKMH